MTAYHVLSLSALYQACVSNIWVTHAHMKSCRRVWLEEPEVRTSAVALLRSELPFHKQLTCTTTLLATMDNRHQQPMCRSVTQCGTECPEPLPPILRIPRDLHLEISDQIGFYDIFALRLTSAYFHSILPPLQKSPTLADTQLEEAEASYLARLKNFLVCGRCKQLRKVRLFYEWELKRENEKHRLCVICDPNDFIVFCPGPESTDDEVEE